MSVREDTYLNKIPYTLTHALKGDLDPGNGWLKLLMAVEMSNEDGPPLDPDLKDQLDMCPQRRESPTEKLLSELGHKGYRVRHLRVWLRAEGLIRAAELLEGGDRTTGRRPLQRSPSASDTWMYEPPSEYHRSQSAEGRGGGETISMQSDCLINYGSHAESGRSEMEDGGGGGTIELNIESVTSLVNTQQPEEGANRSEGHGTEEGLGESEGGDSVDGPVHKSDGSSKSEGSTNDELNALSLISDPNFQHAQFRKKNEKAQPDVSHKPSEDHTPLEGEGGPYQRHDLVGSGSMRHRGTTASGGEEGSDLKENIETEAPLSLPAAPPPSHGVGWCSVVLVTVIGIAALCIALYIM